jgi:flavorubredoxin
VSDLVNPREIAPGVFWIAACMVVSREGKVHHSHNSPYLVVGEDRSVLIDTGPPHHRADIAAAIDSLLAGRPLDYVLPTHPELPHAGNLGDIVARYPDVKVCGDVSDYHLYLPGIAGNLVPLEPGETLDLGGTTLTAVEAVIRDLPNTRWAYDARSRTLFVSDALGFSHYHEAGECTLTSEELSRHPTVEQIGYLNDAALYWTRFVDLERYFNRFDALVARHPIDLMAPAHGAFISNPGEMVGVIKEGMRKARAARRQAPASSDTGRRQGTGVPPPAEASSG